MTSFAVRPEQHPALPVLVVDDDSALIRTLADILRLHGYAPETASTAREGLSLASRYQPALAVVDLRLPDMDGIELVSKLHELSERTEVVVLTGHASLESAVAAMREHSIDYLVKPVQVEQLLQVVTVARERWHRRQVEVALGASEARYRLLFENNPQPFWVFDRETLRFLAVNDAAVRKYGYSRDEFLGMTIADIRPSEAVPAMEEVARAPATGRPRHWRHRRKDGTLMDMDVTTHDVEFGGRAARIVLAVDVTERVAAERAREARGRQQEAIASFGEWVLTADSEAALFQKAADLVAHALELSFASVFQARADGQALTLATASGFGFDEVAGIPMPLSMETQSGYTFLRGEPVQVDDFTTDPRFPGTSFRGLGVRASVTVPIPGPLKPYGVLGVHDREPRAFNDDVVPFLKSIAHIVGTRMERMRTDATLRQAQRLEAVGRLAGGVAHDFNNVLTAISGYAEMLRMELDAGDPRRADADEILRAAERGAGLTGQLLAFSRQQVLQPRELNLNDVVTGMRGMLARLIPEHIALEVAMAPDLGRVRADKGQVEQVILNLCVNARDAMPDGGRIMIETANSDLDGGHTQEHSLDAAGEYVMLAVSDNGSGMDAETKARVFEPFFTTKGPEKGTGLGLATVYGIVKQSGGEISLHSEVGRGTTFKVFLPRVAPGTQDTSGTAGTQGTRAAANAAAPRPAASARETLLLAEDEDAVRKLSRRVLEGEGYTVLAASDGPAALELAARHPGEIHLLVTDMSMPGMTGRELIRRLRERHPGLRVLFLSGYTEEASGQELVGEQSGFLQKPFTSEALAQRVRQLLDTRSASR